MRKKIFISVLTAAIITFVSFVSLLYISDQTPKVILISLCEAMFTGGLISIFPQLIDWHSSESEFSEKLYDEFLNMLEWSQGIDFQKHSAQEIQSIAYKKYHRLLKIKKQYVFSHNMKRLKCVEEMLLNLIKKVNNNDFALASRIIEKDLIPELKKYVEPNS